MKILTHSGTEYEVRTFTDGEKIRRLPQAGDAMRQDHKWLSFRYLRPPTIGQPMYLALEPLAEGVDVTIRTTSPVVQIIY